jgi:hypothetical protein
VTRQELLGKLVSMDDDVLDEMVIDAKCSEASDINNQGLDDQLEYLLGFGFDVNQIAEGTGVLPVD